MTTAIATLEGSSRAVTYATTKEDIAVLAAAYLGLSAAEDYEGVRKAIADLRGRRVAIEDLRVDLKKEALEFGRKVDSAAKELTTLIEAVEEKLKAKKKAIDDAVARERFERENAERLAAEAKAREAAEAEATERRAAQAIEDARLAEIARQQAIEADRILMEHAKIEAERKAEDKRAAAERERLAAEARAQQKRLDDERADHERKLALEVFDTLMRAFFLVSIDTALRKGSARLIEWVDIDFEARTIHVPAARTKSRKGHTVQFTSRAGEALAALPRICPYVFANPATKLPYGEVTLWKRWRAAADGIGLKPSPGDVSVRWHDLRGTSASRMISQGAKITAVQQILDHSNLSTTACYIRVDSRDVIEAYRLLEESTRKPPKRAPVVAEKRKGPRRAKAKEQNVKSEPEQK